MEKITSRRNPLCIHLKKLGSSCGYRRSCGQFLCDGIKLLEEAVIFGAEICTVLTTSDISFPLSIDTVVYQTDRGIIDSLSPLKNAQDVLFVCKIPNSTMYPKSSGIKILLDSVADPGNVGAIIRTANAFGISGVILTGECADPYNPKSVRASMGAIFRQSIINMNITGLTKMFNDGQKFIGSSVDADCRSIHDVNISDAIIVIGNEGRGISTDVLLLCSEKLRIPISPNCESLNAAIAAAIIMWEASRAQITKVV